MSDVAKCTFSLPESEPMDVSASASFSVSVALILRITKAAVISEEIVAAVNVSPV